MHGLFSKPQFRCKRVLKWFPTAFSTAFYAPSFAHACKAAGGCEQRGLWSGKAAYTPYSAQGKVQQAKQGQQAVEQTTALTGLTNHPHACVDAKQTPALPHPIKTFFCSGTFPVEAQEEPINLTKRVPVPKADEGTRARQWQSCLPTQSVLLWRWLKDAGHKPALQML